MNKPSTLEQVLDPLWKNFDDPDSPNLKYALQRILVAMETRAKEAHARASSTGPTSLDPLVETATAFTKCIIAAFGISAIYTAVLDRFENLWTQEAEALSAFTRLCGMIIDEINRDLRESQAQLASAGALLALTEQEQADIAHLYDVAVHPEPWGEEALHEDPVQPEHSTGNIIVLVLALSSVLAPMN